MRSVIWVPCTRLVQSYLVPCSNAILGRYASVLSAKASSSGLHPPNLTSKTSNSHISKFYDKTRYGSLCPRASCSYSSVTCSQNAVLRKSHFSSVHELHTRRCDAALGSAGTSIRSLSSRTKKRPPILMRNKAKIESVRLWRGMTVKELAAALGKDVDTTLEVLTFVKNSEAFHHRSAAITNNSVLAQAAQISGKRGLIIPKPQASMPKKTNSKDACRRPPADPAQMVPRPPVITIMGHVDHGKTTLLDSLRKSNIVDSEFGGITQHIGAFQFSLPSGLPITVLDTPGHAAFSAMRGRGANVTDIVVLVVAADDGVMPQTNESIQHCKRANVPMVVALNKIDKPDADVNRARMSLLQAGLQLEEQGGDVQCVEISAKNGTNLPSLVEAILALAEILEITADPKGLVEASVVEAKQLPAKGKAATCLVQRGTLRPGALLVAGMATCKVRVMYNEHDQVVKEAPPASPVQVTGWNELPSAGDQVLEVPSMSRQKEVIAWRKERLQQEKMMRDKVIVDAKAQEHRQKHRSLLEQKWSLGIRYKFHLNRDGMRPKETRDSDMGPGVAIVLKCDVQGSLEAILQVLETYDSDFVRLDLVTSGVGTVTQTDVQLAKTFSATIFAFNVANERGIEEMAEQSSVEIQHTNIIYRLVQQLQDLLSEQMPSLPQEEVLGEADVLEQFLASDSRSRKKTPVAGCRCVKGILKKDANFRLYRENDLIHEGPVLSMRHVKSEVRTISTDKECGLKFEDSNVHFHKGDRIVCYVVNQLRQETDWRPSGF